METAGEQRQSRAAVAAIEHGVRQSSTVAEAEAAAAEAEVADSEEYQRTINAFYYIIQIMRQATDRSESIEDVCFPSIQIHPLLFSLFLMLHWKYSLSGLALSNSVASK